MKRITIIIFLLFMTSPFFAETSIDINIHEKLEECLSEFYQGRPRDYPERVEEGGIIDFTSKKGNKLYHTKKLRGMEIVCYNLFISKN